MLTFQQTIVMSDPSTPVLIFLAIFFLTLCALAVHGLLRHQPTSSQWHINIGPLSTIRWNNPNATIDEENPPIELDNLPDPTRLTIPPMPHLPPPLPPTFYDFAIYEQPSSSIPPQSHRQPHTRTQKPWVDRTLHISNIAQSSTETLRDSWSRWHQL